jgi:thiamine kinase-like enzyme
MMGRGQKDMRAESADPERLIRALPVWSGPVRIEPLPGGITNRNYLVSDSVRRVVVRHGDDIPEHGVMRFNERAAARAAAQAAISPRVLYAEPPFLVMEFIDGRSYRAEDVRANLSRCVALVKRAHREMPAYLGGPTLCFNVFHIIRDYAHRLAGEHSRPAGALPRFLQAAHRLERAVGPIDLVFGHNDLLAANFIDDGTRLWLLDWDYAGWNTPLFDLANLSSNNGFDSRADAAMLADYFETQATPAQIRGVRALACASLLRETLWSMVSETRSTIDFDYVSYTAENLRRFEAAFAAFESSYEDLR